MITPDLRRKIKELEVQAVRLVSGRFMGEWASNMRGQGLEFRDLREYVSGDDVRRIDWKATARSANPQLRQFSDKKHNRRQLRLKTDKPAVVSGIRQDFCPAAGWNSRDSS